MSPKAADIPTFTLQSPFDDPDVSSPPGPSSHSHSRHASLHLARSPLLSPSTPMFSGTPSSRDSREKEKDKEKDRDRDRDRDRDDARPSMDTVTVTLKRPTANRSSQSTGMGMPLRHHQPRHHRDSDDETIGAARPSLGAGLGGTGGAGVGGRTGVMDSMDGRAGGRDSLSEDSEADEQDQLHRDLEAFGMTDDPAGEEAIRYDGPFQPPRGPELVGMVASVAAVALLAVAAGLTTVYDWVL